eukprot:Skav224745  [mRNA]  locus=scaffold580:21452:30574:- [translate_table: standard]
MFDFDDLEEKEVAPEPAAAAEAQAGSLPWREATALSPPNEEPPPPPPPPQQPPQQPLEPPVNPEAWHCSGCGSCCDAGHVNPNMLCSGTPPIAEKMAPSARRSTSKVLALSLALIWWLDGFTPVLQVQPPVAGSPTRLVAGLDQKKLLQCAPKLLGPGELDRMLKEAKEYKRTVPKKINPPRVPDGQGRWRCNKCGEMQEVKAFRLQESGGRSIPATHCKQCHNEICRDWFRTLRGKLQQLRADARRRVKRELHSFSLNWDDLYGMVKRQHGRCDYSGVPMELCTPNSHWRMSLERVNNRKGYSRQNCVLIAAEFNSCDFSQAKGVDQTTVRGTAQWSPQKVQAVFDLQQQEVDLEALRADIQEARHRPKLHVAGYQAKLPNEQKPAEPGQICCRTCARFLNPVQFTPSKRHPGGPCKACMREYNRAYRSTLRGHVTHLLKRARHRSERRQQEFSLSLGQVLDMLEQQGGRCYYSGVPLEYKRIHRNWRMSIERLDNSRGYTAKNCVLIAIEFNTSDHSRNRGVTKVFGAAQWLCSGTPPIAEKMAPSVRRSISKVLALSLVLIWWLDGFTPVLQVQPPVAGSPTRLVAGLDQKKLLQCAPKLLGPGELDRMLKEAKEFKKSCPKKYNLRRVPDDQGRWRCNKCGEMLAPEAFSLRKNGCRYMPSNMCKQCDGQKSSDWHRTLRGTLQQLLSDARRRLRKDLHGCSLSWDDLYEMVKRQRGRCDYSGVPMEVCKPNSHWRMSLERVNNGNGYSWENCVLIAAEFNTGDWSKGKGVDQATVNGTAQWSPQKVQAVFDLREQEVDLDALRADIQEARQKGKHQLRGCQEKLPDKPNLLEPGQICCRMCSTYLNPANFTPSQHRPGGLCKACTREYNRAYSSTLRGHVNNLLKMARQRAKSKALKFSLTQKQVLGMLEQQGGRCYYSRVPLEYKQIHSDWRMSIERLDNSKGYTAENCVLIAVEFNTSDRSRNKGVTKVFGTSQWSREKVEHIWGKDGWARKALSAQVLVGRPPGLASPPKDVTSQVTGNFLQLSSFSRDHLLRPEELRLARGSAPPAIESFVVASNAQFCCSLSASGQDLDVVVANGNQHRIGFASQIRSCALKADDRHVLVARGTQLTA